MNSPSISEYVPARPDSRLNIVSRTSRNFISSSNLTGLICIVIAIFLLLVPPIPWNIRLTLYTALLIATILRPQTALYLIPICVPWGSLDFIDLRGLRLNSADMLVIFLVIGWLMSFGLRHKIGPRDRVASYIPSFLVIAMLALVGTMILSMIVAINISSSLKEISKWLEFVVVILLGSQYLHSRRQIWIIVALVCLAGISQAFYGYTQAYFNLGPQSFIRDASLRVYGTFDQPNPYAGYINIPLSISIALTLLGRNWVMRILAALTAIILGVAEYLSQSRGGEIALVAALIFIILAGLPRIRLLMGMLIILFLAIFEVLLAGWIPTSVYNPVLRFLGAVQLSFTNPSNQDYSTAERLAHWIAGLHMFMDHPVLGVGIGNYSDAYPRYFITIFSNSLGHAHNYYINIAAETGSIGLIAFALFLLAIFVAGGHSLRGINKQLRIAKLRIPYTRKLTQAPLGRQSKLYLLSHQMRLIYYNQVQDQFTIVGRLTNDRALAIGLLAALIAICTHNLVDDLFVHSLTSLIALLLIALIRLELVTSDISD
jgi:O-antigen ligase